MEGLTQQERTSLERSQVIHITQEKEMLEDRFRNPYADNDYLLRFQSSYYSADTESQRDPANALPDQQNIENEAPAATVQQEERGDNKKERYHQRTDDRIRSQYRTHREAALRVIDHNRQIISGGVRSTISEREKNDRKALLSEDLKSIDLFREVSVQQAKNDNKYNKSTKLLIDWKAQADRAKVYERYAGSLPLESKERESAMKDKEAAELDAAQLRRAYNTSKIANPEERSRETSTRWRHALYDVSKAFFRLFNKKRGALSKEDARYRVTNEDVALSGHLLLNTGRAHMGGTKPMYIYEDRAETDVNGQYKQYLYKEAVNCCGISNTEGAVVTEAASKLQKELRPGKSIKAFTAKHDGKIIGSFQEKVNIMNENDPGRVDLFSWQANPQDTLSDAVKSEIMEEHVLDWVLCNFDTKGENFLQTSETVLLGSDKEASLKFLFSPDAQKMSTTYKPHSNNTIYNVLYSQFAEGKIDLDLEAVSAPITNLTALDNVKFMDIMGPALEAKYKNSEKCERAKALLLTRKTRIKDVYREFFAQLLKQRRDALEAADRPMDHLDEMPLGSENFMFLSDRTSGNVNTSSGTDAGENTSGTQS